MRKFKPSRPFAIDKAPGNELYPLILEHKRYEDVEAFFHKRGAWHNYYTLVHDRLCSYDLFNDISSDIDLEFDEPKRKILIGHAITLAENVIDEHLQCALCYILAFTPHSLKEYFPLPEDYKQRILAMKDRVQHIAPSKQSEGIEGMWFAVLRYLKREPTFDSTPYELNT
jgi:hypothetical protein